MTSDSRVGLGRVKTVASAASEHRDRAPARATVTVLLAAGFVLSAVAALTLIAGTWTEVPFPPGSWEVDLGRSVIPGADDLDAQMRAMQRIAGTTAGLVSLLSLVSLAGLLRQGSRLRRADDAVHWAVGAPRSGFLARSVGEGWRTGAVAGGVSLGAGLALPGVLAATFPGSADAPSSVVWTSLLLVLMGSAILHRARGAGIRAARGRDGGLGRLLSLPGVVAAPALATLVLVGLLRVDSGGPTGPAGVDPVDRMATARLTGSPGERGRALEGWVDRIGGSVGLASTGTVRGAGREARVQVDCGRCSLGGLPLPVRTVTAELHALGPDTFTHLGVQILAGRDFTRDDRGDGPAAVIVSRSMAIRHFENGQAVGRRVRFGEGDWVEVVGVVEDRWDIKDPGEFAVYLPLLQVRPDAVEIFEAKGLGGLNEARDAAPAAVQVEAARPVLASFAQGRWFASILNVLAALALTIALAGVWGSARAEMRARVGELALRRALGARPAHLWRFWAAFVVRQFGGAMAVGAWLAVALAVELERSFGMPPILHPGIWASAALPLFLAFLAGALPPFVRARRSAPATRLTGRLQ